MLKQNKHYAMYRNLAVARFSGCREFITVAVNMLNNVLEKKEEKEDEIC